MTRARLAVVLSAGLAAAALLQVASWATEEKIALDNLILTVGATTYRIPHVEIEGSSLPPAELARLFDGDEAAIDARLSRFSAKRVSAPSVTTESREGGAIETGGFREMLFENIAAGRVGAARAAGGEEKVESASGGAERYVWGRLSSKGADLRQIIHVALSTRKDKSEAAKPLIDEETIESTSFENKRDNLTVTTGRITLLGAKGRALPTPPRKLFARFDKADFQKDGEDKALARDLIEALAAFEAASMEVREIVGVGKGAPAERPYNFKIGRVAAIRLANATVGDIAIEDFVLNSSDEGRIALRRFGLRDLQLATLVESAYPRLGHIEFKGLDADLPDPKTGDAARMKFRLENAEGDFANYRENMPTKFSTRLDKLAIDLAPRGDATSTAQFVALGYRDLGFSAVSDGEWSEKTLDFVFAPTRVEGKDMGAIDIALTLGNVSSAAFSPVTIVSRAAMLGISAKSLDVTLTGNGLVDRLLALEAKQQKTTIAKARADYSKSAAGAVMALAGAGEKTKRIADAVEAYILAPKRLHVRLTAQKGVNALDALAKRPGDILESIEVETSADR